jgi:hypothetical protein
MESVEIGEGEQETSGITRRINALIREEDDHIAVWHGLVVFTRSRIGRGPRECRSRVRWDCARDDPGFHGFPVRRWRDSECSSGRAHGMKAASSGSRVSK